MRILCLTWTPGGSRRIHDLRNLLGAELWNYSIFYKQKALATIRYPIQGMMTLITLSRKKPDVVFVQNPPIFAALACIAYSMTSRVEIVIDHHLIWSMSGFITNRFLKSFIGAIEELCVRKADINTTYADDWARELARMGAEEVLTIYDFVNRTWVRNADLSIRKRFPEDKKIIVMACGTGHPLERPDLLMESVKDNEDLVVVITGNRKYLRDHVKKAQRLGLENVVFTGFLSDKQYRGLIATCNFVANVSDEPYGIPHTITEGLAADRPVIMSGNPSVRKLLGDDYPLIIPHNDVEAIRKIIATAIEREDEFTERANDLYERLKNKEQDQIQELLKLLDGHL